MHAPDGWWTHAPVGESAILVTWCGQPSDRTTAIQLLVQRAQRQGSSVVDEIVPGIASVLLRFNPVRWTAADVWDHITPVLPLALEMTTSDARIVDVAVRYGGEFGPDLDSVAEACGLSPTDVIALHSAQPYPVLMLGFMPGFPYIGELPTPLRLPRRPTPRTHVPAGSVAIANDQTGIYPNTSPGGWHLLGRTTATLFDPQRDPPSLLRPGDLVRFHAIDEA